MEPLGLFLDSQPFIALFLVIGLGYAAAQIKIGGLSLGIGIQYGRDFCKGLMSEVAGRATAFIFPDLNTGNNLYKAVQHSAGAVAIRPVLQGLKKPVNDFSRGCTLTDIVNTVAVTAIMAQSEI